ncbi:MAG: type II toxin-antitoxin system VapC family toxin [Gammaproteobacteria bacterium]|nr:type II toxin-antitoxin system VapC family toxin [Gammaproteobacteria bacterium]MYD80658.1 type II toxin-antitoxin system VapC family toxin [Gammaproteobacteria bacterium]
MIVDSSAVLAVLFREPEAETYEELISDSHCRMSTANALESAMVAEGRRSHGAAELFDDFREWSGIELVPITFDHFSAARKAWRRFGKGRHPAALNFGDCFAYALATIEDEPLLFKGLDFSRTDIRPAFKHG